MKKCADRIIDLGGELKLGDKKDAPLFKDAIEYLKYDLQVSKDGLAWLAGLVEEARSDYTTYENEQELELVEKIGTINWYAKQI